jgi:hypothetical protein
VVEYIITTQNALALRTGWPTRVFEVSVCYGG